MVVLSGRKSCLKTRKAEEVEGVFAHLGSIALEEGKATHSNILAWRIPMDRGDWATVHGVTKSWTQLSDRNMIREESFVDKAIDRQRRQCRPFSRVVPSVFKGNFL